MNTDVAMIDDVPTRFDAIPPKIRRSAIAGSTRRYLGARNNDTIPWPDYTSSHDNELGLGEHMQGIQRIKQHLIVTGGVKTGIRKSQFIIIKMGSQSALQPWSLPKYGYPYKKPDERDCIVKVIDVDRSLWHAGGIQAVGDVVAIPVYGSDKKKPGSEVRFFNFDNPESPKELTGITLVKPDIESKAIAMTRTPDNYYVLMVWDDQVLDFHRSKTTVITEGFSETPVRLRKSEVIGGFQPGGGGQSGTGTYQSLNFGWQPGTKKKPLPRSMVRT